MKEAKKEAEDLCNAFRAEKEAAYQASMQKVRGTLVEHTSRHDRNTTAYSHKALPALPRLAQRQRNCVACDGSAYVAQSFIR